MHHQPQGDSIWGNINTVVEIALNVYYIFAENGEGIMIPKDKAENTISEKAAGQGHEDNGYLCYGRDENMDIPMYEVLQRRVAACDKIKQQAIAQMQEIKRDGSLRLADYFEECNPPEKMLDGIASNHQKIRNGIYFTTAGGTSYFAVHEDVADNFLSPMAFEFGRKSGDYLYYNLTTSAVPIYELRQIYNEVDDLIVSEDSLHATLGSNFRSYIEWYNEFVHEEAKIPPVEAPAALFLQRQLDAANEDQISEYQDHTLEHGVDDFNEQVDDFGFEP